MDTGVGVDTSKLLAGLTMSHGVLCEINKESNKFKAELNSELLNLERKNWCLTMLISKLQGYLLPETTLLVLAARVRKATPAIQSYRLKLQHRITVARTDFEKTKHFMESGFVKMLQTKTNEELLVFEKDMEEAINQSGERGIRGFER
ncbi:unnamed protein product [Orchesella dallaii]|uniref:Uncharacterized protein n=1 Tax=Orchesella dallaii TaxID=48710 RepID=A0ABP1QQZ0_9HEXA